jgi:CubicO group peptidase (beta-lactamase class C family)
MKKLPRKYRDPLIFLSLLIMVPSSIYFISMNFGDQRLHVEKKQWNPAEAADQGIEEQLLKRAAEYVETRLPTIRGLVITKNGRTVHEKYYWKGGPREKDYLHSLNGPILHALVGIAIDKKMLAGTGQPLAHFFPDHAAASGSLTISDLLVVRAPLLWGDGPPEYWALFFSSDRVGAALQILQPGGENPGPAANYAAAFLLAEIIGKAAASSVFEFADKHLFAPMGIATVAKTREKGGFMDPFTGFALRTLDLAKFGHLIMHGGTWEDRQIIPGDWAAKITAQPAGGPGKSVPGGWQRLTVHGKEAITARGEGGQYIVLVPELDLLVAVSSKSLFPLAENSGYDHLFRLLVVASDAKLSQQALTADPEERPYYEPNFVNATVVPDEIRQFFLDFARDIATQDINRILYHYAKGYETKDTNRGFLDKLFLDDDDFSAMYGFWRKIFFGGSGDLEFVQIDKLRIDGNRAYLRGNLKYSYANMNEGSFGWFALENLIKLRGRWLWLGTPEYGEILDRDEYFDAEVSAELAEFIDACGQSLVRVAGADDKACFDEEFLYNGLQQEGLHQLLQPLWEDNSKVKMHITRTQEAGGEALLQGYLENSRVGSIMLPPAMKIARGAGKWRWAGNGLN